MHTSLYRSTAVGFVLALLLPVESLAASTDSAVRYIRYTNTAYGFSTQYPKDWSVDESVNDTNLIVHFSSSTYLPRLSIATSSLEGSNASLEDIAEEVMEGLEETHPQFTIEDEAAITVAGQPALQFTISDVNDEGVDIAGIHVITKKNGRGYVFMLTDIAENEDENVFLFEKMIGSVTFTSPKVVTTHFQSPAFNFEFEYPEGWEVNQSMQTGIQEFVIHVSAPNAGTRAALIQRKLKSDVTQEDLEEELEAHTSGTDFGISRQPFLKENFKFLANASAEGEDGSPQLAAGYQGMTDTDAPLTMVNYLSIGKGRYMYTFKYWVTQSDPATYADLLPAIIESVNFTDDEPKQPWTPPQSFSDVPVTHPYFGSISYMKKMEWVSGYSDGTYKPESHINRAEFTKILINALFPQDINPHPDSCIEAHANGKALFLDVDLQSWFSASICTAKVKGLIQGYPTGMFHPEKDISFAEAAKIVALAFHATAESDAVWYRPYVHFLAAKKAIPPSIASFDAKLTRGEMAELIYRVRSGAEGESLTYEQLEAR